MPLFWPRCSSERSYNPLCWICCDFSPKLTICKSMETSKTLIALLMPKIFLIFWPRCSLERSYNPLCWIQNQGFTQIFTRNTRKLANDSRKTLGHPWYELMTTSDNQIGSDWIRMRMTWGWLRNIAINSRYFSSLFINSMGFWVAWHIVVWLFYTLPSPIRIEEGSIKCQTTMAWHFSTKVRQLPKVNSSNVSPNVPLKKFGRKVC